MRIDKNEIISAAKGKWLAIYERFGIDVGVGKHMPCPVCKGTDRFRYDNHNNDGGYYCNQCGAGDGISLLQKILNIDFKQALEKVSDVVGQVRAGENQKATPDPRIALKKVWESSKKLSGGDDVLNYLQSRKITLIPNNIRFCPNLYESETKTEMPAMVARFQNKEGKPITIHRTYLQAGVKAQIKSPKKIMSPTEKMNGGAVRLFQPGGDMLEANVLGIAEGIETAIAATQMSFIATWACLSSTLLVDFEPPTEIRQFVIFADNDANYTGQKAAYALANKLYLRDFLVKVDVPTLGDWADMLIQQRNEE